MSAIYTIHQIIPSQIPMSACFYDHDEMEVMRRDVVCLAIIKFNAGVGGDSSVVRPMICQKSGAVIDPGFLSGFLGFEINGMVEDWDEKIREMVDVIEGRNKLAVKKVIN